MYKPVIGLEIHVELNTKTKMFCSCSADYWDAEPNSHTCPVCLGLPGALPVINEEAIKKCIQIGLALNCTVQKNSRFERKNYFYPDLPKGYQISQYRWPLCKNGVIVLGDSDSRKEIRINRVHQEEDTAKLVDVGGETGVDFNRSGVPLVEIVTEPDFDNSSDVVEFAKQIHQIVRDLNASNADMERGDMRLEANVSVSSEENIEHRTKENLPNYRVELKNINSFRFMQHAIEYEIKRQSEALDKGEVLTQETRGWNEEKGESYLQRTKEEAHDYRYFPDPDLPELKFTDKDIEKIKVELPELSSQRAGRLSEAHSFPLSSAVTLVNQGHADYFEKAAAHAASTGISTADIANAIVNKRVDVTKVQPHEIALILKSQMEKSLSTDELEKAVASTISDNSKVVDDYKSGKTNALQFLLGQVMKNTRGQANPESATKLLEEKLQNG